MAYIKPIEFEVNRPANLGESLSGGGTHRNDPAFPDWDIVDARYGGHQAYASCIDVSLRWRQRDRIAKMRFWCNDPRSTPSAEAVGFFWVHFPSARIPELLDAIFAAGEASGRDALRADFAKLMGIDQRF